jgi:hypothetical protein
MIARSILACLAISPFPCVVVWGETLARERDPVVVTGGDAPAMIGMAIGEVVAFRYENDWQQIPVQIDERKFAEYRVVYNTEEIPAGLGTMAYVDPATYTGPDYDPLFDANDEIAVMAADAGDRAPVPTSFPAGVQPGSGQELLITDPLDGGTGYVYLFQSDGSLTPDAGQDYVDYSFNLLAGDYLTYYNTASGPNPEDSSASSDDYRTCFADRWIRDELSVYTQGATGVDLLDRHKSLFGPGICTRTEDTFCNGPGAFFTNKDGPVRAIRSYMGANSGPLTQREHLFYRQRQDITTHLRVHAIGAGAMDLYDYTPAASGMVYSNSLNLGGVTVDGQPDVVATGALTWEMITGSQGTLIFSHSIVTDLNPLNVTSYYSDDSTPSVTQCTGDAFEYATSGIWIDQAIPNTDPRNGAYNVLSSRRVVYYETPNQPVAVAQLRRSQAETPLAVTVQPYPLMPADFDRDGDVDNDDVDTFILCAGGAAVPLSPACAFADLDYDGDGDQADYGIVQRCISGQGNPADLECLD